VTGRHRGEPGGDSGHFVPVRAAGARGWAGVLAVSVPGRIAVRRGRETLRMVVARDGQCGGCRICAMAPRSAAVVVRTRGSRGGVDAALAAGVAIDRRGLRAAAGLSTVTIAR